MAINERLIDTEVAAAGNGGGANDAEQGLILHLDASDVDSYDGDGSVWYDISTHDVTVPLSDNAGDLELHLNASDSDSYGGTGTTWTDLSGNDRDGTINGAPPYAIDRYGSFDFTQSTGDYISLTTNSALQPASGGTSYEFWITPDTSSDTNSLLYYGTSDGYGFWLWNNYGTPYFTAYNSSNSTVASFTSGHSISNNTLAHVVFTLSSDTNPVVKIYVDGEFKAKATGSGTIRKDSAVNILLGRYTTGNANDYDGKMHACRVYSKELSGSDVGQNYRHGIDFVYTDLIDDTDLALHFDAADLTSAANTTWTDKANSVALTKSGTVSYDDELGDFIDFGSGYYGNDTATNTIKDSNADYSVEFWYNWDNVSGNNVILGVMQDASNRGALLYFSGSTMDFYNYKDGTMGGSQYTQSTWSTLGITTGKWYHICYVIDSSTDIKTYVDGKLKVTSTSNAGGTHWTSMDGIRIGDMETLSYAIDGKLGQMRIYKGKLSPEEVTQNFNFTKNNYPSETHGTLSSTSWNPNNYFEFGGSTSTVDLGVDGLGTSQDISISVWFKPESGNVNDGTFLLYQPGVNSHSTPHYSHTIQVESAGHREFIQYSSNSGSVSTTNFNSGVGSLDLGSWQHFVLTREDGELKWYKNGNTTPIATADLGDITTSFGATTLVSRIGGRIAGTSPNAFEGDISKVKVYDRAISPSEVADLYAEGKGH